MSISVWHRTNSLFGIIPQSMEPHRFVCVAELDTEDPDQAFAWSQHQDMAWHHHPTHVLHVYEASPRSTSVGDILEWRSTGKCVIVARVGFQDLPNWHFPASV